GPGRQLASPGAGVRGPGRIPKGTRGRGRGRPHALPVGSALGRARGPARRPTPLVGSSPTPARRRGNAEQPGADSRPRGQNRPRVGIQPQGGGVAAGRGPLSLQPGLRPPGARPNRGKRQPIPARNATGPALAGGGPAGRLGPGNQSGSPASQRGG